MTLHIYAQAYEHHESYIVGTREELAKLRDSISNALNNKSIGRSSDSLTEHFTSDGEGYDLTVKVIPNSIESKLELPYAESIERSLGRDAFSPDLVPTE